MPEISPVLNMLAPFAGRPIRQLVTVNEMTVPVQTNTAAETSHNMVAMLLG